MIATPGANPVPSSIGPKGDVGYLQWFVFGLFFIFGGVTSLNDVLVPKLKELFSSSFPVTSSIRGRTTSSPGRRR